MKYVLAAAIAFFAMLGVSQAAQVSPSTAIENQVSKSEAVTKVQHWRWGSGGYGWHNRYRSHWRWGSRGWGGGYGWHNRARSHWRWGSRRW